MSDKKPKPKQSLPDHLQLFLQAPMAIAIYKGPEYIVEFVNPRMCEFYGRTLDQLLNKKIFDALPEARGQGYEEVLANIYQTGESFAAREVSVELIRGGRPELLYFNYALQPIKNQTGSVTSIMAIATEITQQVRARTRVEEQNKVLEMITSGAQLEETLNSLVESIENQTNSGLKGSVLLLDESGEHLLHGAAPNLPDEYNRQIDGIQIGEGEGSCGTAAALNQQVIVTDIQQDPLWKKFKKLAKAHDLASCWSTPITSSDGKVLGTFALYYSEPKEPTSDDLEIIDFATKTAALVIERAQSRKKLDAREAELNRFKFMADHAADPFLLIRRDGTFAYLNDIALERWGYSATEIHQLAITDIDLNFSLKEFQKVFDRAQKDQVEAFETTHQRKDGSLLPVEISISGLTFKQESFVFAIARDMSERKQLERQKDEFLGIASHELKTPVTSIKAYGQFLQRLFSEQGHNQAVTQLKKMDTQINKLTSLISDLLDVTKINAGKLDFYPTKFDYNTLVNEIVGEVQLTTRTHSLELDLDDTVELYADQERLGQVLTNLLTNAIKYSPNANKVLVTTKLNKTSVTTSVTDFGLGIPKAKLGEVFNQFFRISGPKFSTFPGLGLGLYISSQIIKREGGKIWVKSKENQGSTFSFKLPVKAK